MIYIKWCQLVFFNGGDGWRMWTEWEQQWLVYEDPVIFTHTFIARYMEIKKEEGEFTWWRSKNVKEQRRMQK